MWIGFITIFFYFHIESVVYIFVVVELMYESKDCEHFNLILMDLIVDLPVTINAEQLKLPNHELHNLQNTK